MRDEQKQTRDELHTILTLLQHSHISVEQPNNVTAQDIPSSSSMDTHYATHYSTQLPPRPNTPLALQQMMELPTFDGTDAQTWLAQATQYFLVHHTPMEQRLDLVLIALYGLAMASIQLLLRRCPHLSWEQFTQEILLHFGTVNTLDGYEALRVTQHDGTLDEYIDTFESRLAQLPDLTDKQYLGFFLGGLVPQIRMHLRHPSIMSYSAVVQMAKRVAQFSTPSTSSARSFTANARHTTSR